MASSARHPCFGDLLPERIGYVQCNFCATILLVGVPCVGVGSGGGLQLKTVAVQCGSGGGILSVTLPPSPPTSVELPLQEPGVDPPSRDSDESSGEDREAEAAVAETRAFPAVNKPPERKQRTSSAYNCFIKEEIRRIKDRDPNITHKEAFSAASKNGGDLEDKGDPNIPTKRTSMLLLKTGLTYQESSRKLKYLPLLQTISRSASCKEGKQD